LAALTSVGTERCLHLIKQVQGDDPLMLAGMSDLAVDDLTNVQAVLKQVVERPAAKRQPSPLFPIAGRAAL
jgi:hypothetical protein